MKNTCIVSRESAKHQSKPGRPLCPAFPHMKTLHANPDLQGPKEYRETLQALTAKLPASLLRSGSRILRMASR